MSEPALKIRIAADSGSVAEEPGADPVNMEVLKDENLLLLGSQAEALESA